MTLTLTFMYFICSKMGIIWKFYVGTNGELSSEPILTGLEAISSGNQWLLRYWAAFFLFLPHFFIKCQNMQNNIKKLISDIQMYIFCLLGKKWGKNWKKRRGGALGIDFPKKLLQVPSKSVHNLARKRYERTNFHKK